MKLDQMEIYICTGRQGENFLFQVTTFAIYGDPAHSSSAYILKSGDSEDQTPQIIWIFRRKIFWERENY